MSGHPWDEAIERHRAWRTAHPDATSTIRPLTDAERAEGEDWLSDDLPDGARLLWGDDQSNLAGVYGDGPLTAFVFVLMHDDPDVAPRFESAADFVDRVLLDDDDVRDLGMLVHSGTCPLPPADLPPDALAARTALALALLATVEPNPDSDDADEAGIQAVRSALALVPHTPVPAEILDALAALLAGDNLYVWQDVPRLLAVQDYRGHGFVLRRALADTRNEPSWETRRARILAVLA